MDLSSYTCTRGCISARIKRKEGKEEEKKGMTKWTSREPRAYARTRTQGHIKHIINIFIIIIIAIPKTDHRDIDIRMII